jgi:hypothetical protein
MKPLLTVNAGQYVAGREIEVPDGFEGVAVEVLGGGIASGITVTTEGLVGGKSIGILCHGHSRVSDSTVYGMGTCFEITGDDVQLRSCDAWRAATGYGYVFDTCRNAILDGCLAEENWLDGFKFRRLAFDCALMACTARHNGRVYQQTGKGAGDGLDCYAGAQDLYLERFLSDFNHGNGIAIKSGPLNTQPGGRPDGITAVDCVCRNNRAVGLAAYGDSDRKRRSENPLPCHVTIRGGQYIGNGWEGIYLACEDSTADGFRAEGNKAREQVVVERWSKNVTVNGKRLNN